MKNFFRIIVLAVTGTALFYSLYAALMPNTPKKILAPKVIHEVCLETEKNPYEKHVSVLYQRLEAERIKKNEKRNKAKQKKKPSKRSKDAK